MTSTSPQADQALNENATSYFHLSGAMLGPRSVVLPGNWGRMIKVHGWQHNQALREMALEAARLADFPYRPSRLEAAFVMPTAEEARNFRRQVGGFGQHLLYRVSLCDPKAASHLTDSRLCGPHGTIRPNWARVYWMDFDDQPGAIPGMDWHAATGGMQLREIITLSPIRIEERID
jgi:hypothetical protein